MPHASGLGELIDEGAGVVWTWPSPDRPGVYRVCRGEETVFAQAIEIPAEESDLEYLPPEVIRDRLAAGREIFYRSAAAEEEQRDDFGNGSPWPAWYAGWAN